MTSFELSKKLRARGVILMDRTVRKWVKLGAPADNVNGFLEFYSKRRKNMSPQAGQARAARSNARTEADRIWQRIARLKRGDSL
jgi:hypothetical protein